MVLLIPGGVQECLYMEPHQETIFLKQRFGFVKMALQTGAALVPAFAFGQSHMCVCGGLVGFVAAVLTPHLLSLAHSFHYARPGPPLFPASAPRVLSKLIGFAPILFWGRWGTPVPFAVPVHVVVGKPIPVKQGTWHATQRGAAVRVCAASADAAHRAC